MAPWFHGVMAGDIPPIGLGADPKNMPVGPPTPRPGMFVGISMPYLHFSASKRRSKQPVPAGASWPSMMFSDTPFMGSLSPCTAASIKTSTVSSKEHFMSGPVSWRLTPWRVMAIRCPRHVMVSHSSAKWR